MSFASWANLCKWPPRALGAIYELHPLAEESLLPQEPLTFASETGEAKLLLTMAVWAFPHLSRFSFLVLFCSCSWLHLYNTTTYKVCQGVFWRVLKIAKNSSSFSWPPIGFFGRLRDNLPPNWELLEARHILLFEVHSNAASRYHRIPIDRAWLQSS
jgi:hypothetical protein